MFGGAWYNGDPNAFERFLSDRQSYRLGVARVRQVRAKNGELCVLCVDGEKTENGSGGGAGFIWAPTRFVRFKF